jgi:hypothetical protein
MLAASVPIASRGKTAKYKRIYSWRALARTIKNIDFLEIDTIFIN